MRLVFCLLASLFCASAACADVIGVFSATSGQVQVLRGEEYLAVKPGVEVVDNDIVETGKESSAQLDMEDGSVLKLGPETRLSLGDYQLDANKNVVSATLDILSGWLRFAVAKLKPDGRYKFNTPVLTIGVRGTEGTIEAENEQGGLQLEEGAVDVSPFGPDIRGFPPVRVVSGEFIQRLRGQPLAKLAQPPAGFVRRLPPIMRGKLVHRAQLLKERGVPPRLIRKITHEDARRFLEHHPYMKERLRERFRRFNINGQEMPDKGGNVGPMRERGSAAPGIGGQVLRERQLRMGRPSDPQEVSEAMRRRFQEQQLHRGFGIPSSNDKLPQGSQAVPSMKMTPPLTAPSREPAPRDKGSAAILPAVKPTLQETPVEPRQDDGSNKDEQRKTLLPLRQSSPFIMQQPAPTSGK